MNKKSANDRTAFTLRGIESFFIGGENTHLDLPDTKPIALAAGAAGRALPQSGDYQVNQMYVQGFLNGKQNGNPPLLMWHGGGMTGVTWESTPDGRAGWLELALRDGYDVYVSDAVERGRASVPPTAIVNEDVIFRPKELSWEIFRMGPNDGYASDPGARRFFEGQRFPTAHYDSLANQFVARWPALTETTERTYARYLETFDKVILMAHSQGTGFAQKLSPEFAERLAAVILVEPSGAPDLAAKTDLSSLASVPHLVVWGDFFDLSPIWQNYRQTVETYLDRLRDAGIPVDVIDLPTFGINGNSHCPMMDDNSHEIWVMIADWISAHT